MLDAVSRWFLPLLLMVILVWGLCRRVEIYRVFIEGARDGLMIGLRITPYLLAMLVAIGVFRASGGLDLCTRALAPCLSLFGVPSAVAPLGLMRPLSGSGGLGLLANLLRAFGPDSRIGLIGSVVQGSTETTFYILTVYLGAVGITRLRHTWIAGLAADLASFLVAMMAVRVLFDK